MRKLLSAALAAGAILAIAAAFLIAPRIGHPVTPEMQAGADAASGRPAPGAAAGLDPASVRPSVLIFIARDCPCSEAYEPFTHALFEAYGERASFVGVIAGDKAEAEAWRRDHDTPFPVMPDPDRRLAKAYGAERSAYTALLSGGARIEKLWPGYSAEMLRDLGSRLAKADGGREAALEVAGAPDEPTSGCVLAP